jgi:hypothetical protein
MEQVNFRSHYLHGSRGGTPNGGGGDVAFAPKNLDPQKVMFCAATAVRTGAVCSGRHRADDVIGLLPRNSSTEIKGDDPNLAAFLALNGQKSEIGWCDVPPPPQPTSLTPRKSRITNDGGKTWIEQRVWGEGCDATRHFDCISFICWCLDKQKSGFPFLEIPQFFYSVEDRLRLFGKAGLIAKDMTGNDDIWPADILIYGKVIKPADQAGTRRYFADRITSDQAILANQKASAAGRARAEADLLIDQADVTALDNNLPTDSFLPRLGIGQNLHHIAFCRQDGGKATVEALDSAQGVTKRDNWGDPVRRIRLDDVYF